MNTPRRPSSPSPLPLLRLALAALLALSLAACGGEDKTKGKKEKTVPVTVTRVEREDVPNILNAVGNVEPVASVEVKSRVGGIIDAQYVRDGQEVRKGDPLFRIDPRPFDLAVMEAQAQLDRDRAHLDKAQEDLKRYSKLRQMNVVAQEQYDTTFAEATSLQNTIRLNEAAVAKARLDREYASITAPISGRVGIVQVNEGNVIKANDDRTLCVINQIRPINVAFSLPERHLGAVMERFSQGALPVSVAPSGAEDRPVTAMLSAVDNAVDTATGAFKLLAVYPNDDNRLWPGQFARVELTLHTIEGALLVPTRAVQPGLNGSYVYVVKPAPDDPTAGVAEARDVTTGNIVGQRTVILKGLEPGEMVVLDGQVALAPGIRVSIKGGGQKDATKAGEGQKNDGAAAPAAKDGGQAQ